MNNRIVYWVLGISILLLIFSRLGIYFLLKREFEKKLDNTLYSVCYVLVYVSLFAIMLSMIGILINFIKQNKKSD